MGTPSVGQSRLVFGLFEADISSGALYRNGRKVPLQEKPFRILALLLERPGEVVAREQVQKQLWPEGTFVDFDEGLDTALRKLRYALGDSAQNPTFIQTIPRRGYRFIAPVSNGAHPASPLSDPSPSATSFSAYADRGRIRRYFPSLAILAVLLFVAYGAYRSKSRELDPPRFQTARLTDNGQVQGVAISADGRYLAYARGDESNQSLWLQEIAAHSDLQILSTGTGFHGLTFSPNGASIYFVRADQNDPSFKYLYSMPTHGGPVRKLITDVDSPVSFSPDGTEFVYEHSVQPRDDINLKIANADGSNDRILTVIHGGSGMLYQPGPNWSPDGRTIAVPVLLVSQPLRWVLDLITVANGTIRELYSSPQDLGRPVWLPGGTALMFPQLEKATQRSQLWTISFPEGRARPVTHDLSDYGTDLDMTTDGHTFVTTARTATSHVWIAPALDLLNAQQVTSDALPVMEIAEAPDGKLLARSHDFVIWMMLTDGSQRIRFTDLQPADGPITCGDSVILRSDAQELVRLDKDGSHPTVLARGKVYSPVCSADGAFIFYFTWDEPQKIWKVPIKGGSPHLVADVRGDMLSSTLAASPDGRFLAYLYSEFSSVPSKGLRIAVIPAGGGAPLKQFGVSEGITGPIWSFRWSPTGKGLQYLLTQNGVTNLWEQPFAGGNPKQKTNFVTGQTFDFNWSLDGRKLLLTRGSLVTDVALLSTAR